MKKYRVKVTVNNTYPNPETKYIIQQRVLAIFWADVSDATTRKDWAYQTCEEMNTPYEVIAKARKTVTKS